MKAVLRSGKRRSLWLGLIAGLCAFAIPASSAFGEGSVDINQASGDDIRQGLTVGDPTNATGGLNMRPLMAYAQAGETIQLATSMMGLGDPDANILVFAPGADPTTATPLLDCAASQPGTGRIDSRAEELAGPLPNAGGYDTCDFTVPADGIYQVVMIGVAGANPDPGTVDAPRNDLTQGNQASMWDVTVRDVAGAVQDGRVFTTGAVFRSSFDEATAGDFQGYVYTKTGYEYQVNFYDHGGGNWILTANDRGVVDSQTGERTFASFAGGDDMGGAAIIHFEAVPAGPEYPIFFNRVDPLVITGPGGLAETLGYSDTPISPASEPIENLRFRGSAGANMTGQGFGGTIQFNTPSQMAGLGYTVEIDMNRDGVFGNNADIVDDTGDLAGDGANAYDWNGRNANGDLPPCGVYRYQVRSSLSEVHFTMTDVEESGGTRIERLSLPGDPELGDPLAASYNNHDPYKNGYVVTDGTPTAVTDGISGVGFNAWDDITGNTDYIDTWTRLPEIAETGRFRIKCPRLVVKKKAGKNQVSPGGVVPYKIVVRNKGEGIAQPVRVCDRLPKGLKLLRAKPSPSTRTARRVCWRFPSLDPGKKRTFRVTAQVKNSTQPGKLRNTATVTGCKGSKRCKDKDPEDVTVTPPPVSICASWRVSASC